MAQFGFASVFEERVVVTGPSCLLFPGLEVGYERRSGHVPQPWIVDSAFRGQMERYIHESLLMMQGIDQLIQRVLASSKKVIIWGTGQLTMKLLRDTALKAAKVVASVDGNPVSVGKTLRGVPILRPEELENRSAPIILATLLHTQGTCNMIDSLGLPNPVVALHAH